MYGQYSGVLHRSQMGALNGFRVSTSYQYCRFSQCFVMFLKNTAYSGRILTVTTACHSASIAVFSPCVFTASTGSMFCV